MEHKKNTPIIKERISRHDLNLNWSRISNGTTNSLKPFNYFHTSNRENNDF